MTVLHQGKLLAEGSMEVGPGRSEGDRSLSRSLRTDDDAGSQESRRRLRPERGDSRPDLRVGAEEILAVMGRNGMGKTTLLKSLIGLLPRAPGQIEVDGVEITEMQSFERVRQRRRLRAAGPA